MGLFFSFCFTVQSQKELWGNNDTQSYIDYSNPAAPVTVPYYGNISKFDINGQNGKVVHVFDGINGKLPKGKLFQASNGKVYGTTNAGGNTFFSTPNGTGVLYEYDLILNKYRVIYNFEQYPGEQSITGVIEPIFGKLYGSIGYKVFSYDLNTEQFSFVNNIFTGASINNELMKASNGLLYGTTSSLSSCSGTALSVLYGTISRVNINTNNLDIAYYLNCGGYDGINSNVKSANTLIEVQLGKLYGTVPGGFEFANTLNGLIFEFNINTNTFTKKIDFDGDNLGDFPDCMVNADNGKLYGICQNGGTNVYIDPNSGINYISHLGTLFEYNVTTNTITKLHDFGSQQVPTYYFTGMHPKSIMKASTGFYFGVSDNGLFKFNPADNSVIMPTPLNTITIPPTDPNAFVTESLIEICRKPSYKEFTPNTFNPCVNTPFTYDIQNTNATTYVWKKDGVIVPLQTTGVLTINNLIASDTGVYTCTMTNECGTTTTMNLNVNVNCLDNETFVDDKNEIVLYPNPAKNTISIHLPENETYEVKEIAIANILGQKVIGDIKNAKNIDVSSLQKGIYILQLKTDNGDWNGKFVKE